MDKPLEQGAIVWVTPPGERGLGKRRPAVVLTASEEILLDQPVVVAALTTTFPNPAPPDHVVLPWSPHGHPVTRLRRRSAAVCTWLFEARPSEAEPVGRVPTRHLLDILRRLPDEQTPEGGGHG